MTQKDEIGTKEILEDLVRRWADELAVMRAIEQRGIAVVTTSGALLTLLLGAAALARGGDPKAWPALTGMASFVAGFALLLFAAAGITAILTNLVGPPDCDDEAALRARYLDADPTAITRRIMERRIELLAGAIKKNNRKAWWLGWAVAFEGVAVGLLALSVLLGIFQV